MAPVTKMKTYSGPNNSIVKNSFDAFNVLFAKNMTKRLIGKNRKKKKCSVKPLPTRTRSETVLIDDSLHVSTEDTFDKLLKGNVYREVKNQSQSLSFSKSQNNKRKFKSGITESNSFHSPIMTRSRKKTAESSNSLSVQEVVSSTTNNLKNTMSPYMSRLTQPTENKVDVSLEVEKVKKKDNSSSYIENKMSHLSQEINNTQSVCNNIFTKSFREKQLIHCSTPLVPFRSRRTIVNHTISPIKNLSSLVKESFEEIKNWDNKFPLINVSTDENHKNRRSSKHPKRISEEYSFAGFHKEEQREKSFTENFQIGVISSDKSEYDVSLRNRNETESVKWEKNNTSLSQPNLTVNLDTFSNFEIENNQTSKNSTFHKRKCHKILDTPVNFVTKRRKKYSKSDWKESTKELSKKWESVSSQCIPEEYSENLSQLYDLSSRNHSTEGNNLESIRIKELVVNLSNISILNTISDMDKSMESTLSSFEQFYSKSFKEVSDQYPCDNEINTAKDAEDEKHLIVNLTRNQYDPVTDPNSEVQNKVMVVNLTRNDIFENFYSKNYNSSDDTINFSVTDSKLNNTSTINQSDDSVIESSYVEKGNKNSKDLHSDVKKNSSNVSESPKTIKIDDSVSKSKNESIQFKDTNSILFESVCSAMSDTGKSLSTTGKSLLQESCRDHLSDIIESSIQDSSQINNDGFKVPVPHNKKKPSKILILKAGKNWRRSFSLYRRSSILIDNTKQEKCPESVEKCRSSRIKLSEAHHRIPNRLSIRVVPIGLLHPTEIRRRTTLLEDYASNASYVPDQVLEDSLENSIRCLSLSERRSITNNHLPVPVPVTAREVVLRRCGQTEPIPFSECYPESTLQNCQKIGEGVYGEVFLFKNPKGGTSVMKVIPIEGDQMVNGERQKKFDEILSEVVIAMELSNLRNKKDNKNVTSAFSEVQKIQCVQGRYPEKLLDLWELYEETHGSENDYPDIFREDQLYIVLQLANGGKDLESYLFNNACQAYAMFKQVAFALAVAENKLLFEHRDLHWGNILLSTVEKNKVVELSLDGENFRVQTMGVEVTIIDFTLSRIEYDGVVIFNDLALDPELFTAEGDYQFEIYKLMQKKNRNNWLEFEPYTNLLWLHYTLDKAITALRYKNTQSKTHKDNLMKLKRLYNEVLSYKSVKEFVLNSLL